MSVSLKVIDFLEREGIVPSLKASIVELIVPESDAAERTTEAKTLPTLDIDELTLQARGQGIELVRNRCWLYRPWRVSHL